MDEQSPEQDETTRETPTKKRGILPGKRVVLPGALYWFMEFLVVFAGVFAAFLLAEYRANREEQEQRELITEALVEEIEAVTGEVKGVIPEMREFSGRLDSLIQAGDKPRLEVDFGMRSTGELHMWETARTSGVLRLLDVETMVDLSDYYNSLNHARYLLRQFESLTETFLLPNADAPIEEFYDPATDQLRPKFQWYPRTLRELVWVANRISEEGDSLLTKLKPDYQPADDSLAPRP